VSRRFSSFHQYIICILIFLLVLGCNQKRTGKTNPQALSNETIQELENKPNEGSTAEGSTEVKLERKGEQSGTAAPYAKKEPQMFLSHNFVDRKAPEDFSIGPLEDYYTVNAEIRGILSVVDRFCGALTERELKAELIDEQNRLLLEESLGYFLKNGIVPQYHRIGLIHINDDGSSHVPVRFFSKKGISEGDIYLVKRETNWFISDVQVDFQRLNQEYVRSDEEFVPRSYNLLFSNTF
jgi:hypothetical protein